ncbi:hypothetical protein MtrunA17_Chr8g0358691 [Medicago truncatula]|uniref:Transmembrane protein n=1 Tax=Medicago truncatula TaxID=3880 RepID=A0A396GIH7_MEDTR|nr:hypothetical protein MtrunA17_Chr8g0358691 [Medicago truncatula]
MNPVVLLFVTATDVLFIVVMVGLRLLDARSRLLLCAPLAFFLVSFSAFCFLCASALPLYFLSGLLVVLQVVFIVLSLRVGFVEEKHKKLCFGLGREERDSADELFAGLELMHAYDCFLDMDTLFLGSLSDNNNKK